MIVSSVFVLQFSKHEVYSVTHNDEPHASHKPAQAPRRKKWRRFISYVKRKWNERAAKKKNEGPTDRAARRTATATVWMAIFTLVLAITSGLTIRLLVEGGGDTHNLAEAAGKQAAKMETMSAAADKIKEATERMGAQEQRIADNAQKSLDASIAAYRLDQRAWMQANIVWPPAIGNSGHTPAFDITDWGNLVGNDKEVDDVAKWWKTRKGKEPKIINHIAVMFPGQTNGLFGDILDKTYPNNYQEVTGHHQVVYLIGEITYWTFHKKHTTRFCGIWIPEGKGFNLGRGCNTWNYAD